MTKIYLVRHGQTEWNCCHRLQGRTDIPLNAIGKEQARCGGRALTGTGIGRIITSPLGRAKETAEIIREFIGPVPMEYDERLLERNFGTMEGTFADERLAETWPKEVGLESYEDMLFRMCDAMEDYRKRFKNETLLVVTHGSVLHSFLMKLMNNSLSVAPHELINAGINRVDYEEGWRVTAVNLSGEEFAKGFSEGNY